MTAPRRPAHHLGRDPMSRCRPFAEWPMADQAAWQAALSGTGRAKGKAPLARRSPAGRTMLAQGYGRWLTWLATQVDLDPAGSAVVFATPERLEAYADHLLARNADYTVLQRLDTLRASLRVLAPQKDWRVLGRLAGAIRCDADPVRDKRAKLRSADDLRRLGETLMTKAQEDMAVQLSDRDRAALYRDGLLIALLAARALRMKNFTRLTLGRQLVQQGGDWWLELPASETKSRHRLEAPLPADLNAALDLYLERYRPVLLAQARASDADDGRLWISTLGRAMTENSVGYRILAHTRRAFGVAINPHLFRDALATTIAETDPNHAHMAAPILGHATLATTERYYDHGKGIEACHGLHAALQAARHKGNEKE